MGKVHPSDRNPPFQKLSDDERQIRRELLELLFDPPYRKLPLMHILESAYHTLLIEKCIERKLIEKKMFFSVRKKGLETQLEKVSYPILKNRQSYFSVPA